MNFVNAGYRICKIFVSEPLYGNNIGAADEVDEVLLLEVGAVD